jgi:hypothetical protein
LVTYAAKLDDPRRIPEFLARLLAALRRQLRTPHGSRALGPFRPSVLVLRWFRDGGCVHYLARDADITQATGYHCHYHYLLEGIDVLAQQAPGRHDSLTRCQESGTTHIILDGTPIESNRIAGARDNGIS